MSRGEELKELASDLSRAAERARRLGLPTTLYLLSMALVEVREASAAAADDEDDGDDGAA
ncbi:MULTISPECIES: hypothetical protein [Bradyrhizobium]|uniref:Uncharacterized protein n=1 Tax=Bradyrhizobium diversitatis TaxID=2755406 RepID=A0ABS0P374_9BRAD|nr:MULTISPECIES: hypothetical protein [Bradyrhizobium]KYK50407.1 hypothetical protein A1D31_20070 [Bradyrhizobium liaoningense]MBH5387706.1 hypothetical protein [Bradyrhizobium diversitatis]UPJ66421.1 hypothetical protein IVB23_03295 [Bradyrhizobium sp. 191]